MRPDFSEITFVEECSRGRSGGEGSVGTPQDLREGGEWGGGGEGRSWWWEVRSARWSCPGQAQL